VFAKQKVGVKQVSDRIWLVSLMDYDLGYFDDETCRLEPIENPFGPKGLPMSPEWPRQDWAQPSRSKARKVAGRSLAKAGAPAATRTRDPRLRRPVVRFANSGHISTIWAWRSVMT